MDEVISIALLPVILLPHTATVAVVGAAAPVPALEKPEGPKVTRKLAETKFGLPCAVTPVGKVISRITSLPAVRTIQRVPAAFEQEEPSAVGHSVTVCAREIAVIRAVCSAPTNSFPALVKRARRVIGVKLGAAMAQMI
jgi:hypothetical protein